MTDLPTSDTPRAPFYEATVEPAPDPCPDCDRTWPHSVALHTPRAPSTRAVSDAEMAERLRSLVNDPDWQQGDDAKWERVVRTIRAEAHAEAHAEARHSLARSMHRAVFATFGRCEGKHADGHADCQQLAHELALITATPEPGGET